MRATIVLGELGEGLGLGVREVVRDWSAAGLLADSLWLDPSRTPARWSDLAAAHVDRGRADPCALLETLAAERATEVCLVVLATGPTILGQQQAVLDLNNRLVQMLGGGAVDRRLLLVPGEESTASLGSQVWAGWKGFVLLPEDSLAPVGAVAPISSQSAPGRLVGQVASGLASLSGMWLDTDPPVTQADSTGSGSVRAVRVFVRRVAAGPAIESVLRGVLEATGRGRVGPDWTELGPEAATDAAQLLLRQYGELVDFAPARTVPRPQPAEVGAVQAIRLLASYLTGALRSAPRRWWSEFSAATASATARAVHEAVFGDDEDVSHVVTVGGHRAVPPADSDGERVGGPSALNTGQVERLLRLTPGVTIAVPPTGEGFWRAFRSTAFGLLDGGAGTGHQGAAGRIGVVLDASAVSPPPRERIAAAAGLAGDPAASEIVATDTFALLRTREFAGVRLASEHSGGRTGERERLVAAIDATVAHYRGSLTTVVGMHLFGQLGACRASIDGLLEDFESDTATTDLEKLRAVNQQMRKAGRRTAVALLAVVVVAVVLGVLPVITWPVATAIGVVLGLGVLGAALRSFLRLHRHYFQLEHRLRLSDWRSSQGPLALVHLISERARLAQLNTQASAWSAIVADAVHRPVGRPSAAATELGIDLDGALPLSVSFADAVPERTDPGTVARLRRTFYRPGWLSELWQQRQSAVLQRWAQTSGVIDPGEPLADRLDRLDGPARALVTASADPGQLSINDLLARGRALQLLDENGADLPLTRLVPVVRSREREQSMTEFFQDLLMTAADSRHFSGHYFSPTGQMILNDLTVVDHTELLLSRGTRIGDLLLAPPAGSTTTVAGGGPDVRAGARRFDQIIVRIDYSVATTPDSFAFGGPADPAEPQVTARRVTAPRVPAPLRPATTGVEPAATEPEDRIWG